MGVYLKGVENMFKKIAVFIAMLGLMLLRAAIAGNGFTVDLQTALI